MLHDEESFYHYIYHTSKKIYLIYFFKYFIVTLVDFILLRYLQIIIDNVIFTLRYERFTIYFIDTCRL